MSKRILLIALFLCCWGGAVQAQSIQTFFDEADALFGKFVDRGSVDYAGLTASPDALNKLVTAIGQIDRNALGADDELAFLVNSYNILVLKGVVNHYPIASPLEVAGFFDREKYTVSGQSYTLNDLEKGDIFKKFPDARLHFVLVCAAEGCPILIDEAYRGVSLEQQMETQTRLALNTPIHVRPEAEEKTVHVSQLFSWYAADFTQNGSVIDYINTYRNDPIPADYKLKFITYDWRLNDLKNRQTTGDASAAPGATAPNVLAPNDDLQSFTPSTLLAKGQIDIKIFNNLYTQTAFFNNSGKRIENNRRDTYFTSIIALTIGHSPSLNFGLDLYPKSVRVGSAQSSPLNVLTFATNHSARTALAAVVPKVKFTPFKKAPALAIQTGLYIPVSSDLEGRQSGRPFLDYDDPQLWTQAFFDLPISPSLLVYLEGGLFFRYDGSGQNRASEWVVPAKAILNYYASPRWTIYGVTEVTPFWNKNFGSLYTQVGAGLKFLVAPRFEIETLATVFPLGINKGAGQTYNFGFRFIR